ncbi:MULTISPECIES: hypothetical protein [unclassified Methylophilus]|jgi:hypothetical protein|uniref:hypothetical protein n=1 Tax=unclassified Methylophilus TaxID=2630143 RepID=UPI001E2FAB27|nr:MULTISPECIES: hypothetical protein [unclassified Methylophilus]
MRKSSSLKLGLISICLMLLAGCAHPISINPTHTPDRPQSNLKPKKVAYVLSDTERNTQVTTPGGGGDKVSYYAYKDSEKAIRDALRAVYQDVVVIKSATDSEAIRDNAVELIYTPVITTASSSDSAFTWPPTFFRVELSCNVTDTKGNLIKTLKVDGNGYAEFSEFKTNLGLAGSRATSDLSEKLKKEILNNPALF